jgi:hypothetical protein
MSLPAKGSLDAGAAVTAPKEVAVPGSRAKRGTAIVHGAVQTTPEGAESAGAPSKTSNDNKEEGDEERERRERQMKIDEEIEQDRRRAAAFAGYQDDEGGTDRPYTRRWTREVLHCGLSSSPPSHVQLPAVPALPCSSLSGPCSADAVSSEKALRAHCGIFSACPETAETARVGAGGQAAGRSREPLRHKDVVCNCAADARSHW